jgi:hypothetical protein
MVDGRATHYGGELTSVYAAFDETCGGFVNVASGLWLGDSFRDGVPLRSWYLSSRFHLLEISAIDHTGNVVSYSAGQVEITDSFTSNSMSGNVYTPTPEPQRPTPCRNCWDCPEAPDTDLPIWEVALIAVAAAVFAVALFVRRIYGYCHCIRGTPSPGAGDGPAGVVQGARQEGDPSLYGRPPAIL